MSNPPQGGGGAEAVLGSDVSFSELDAALQKRFPENLGTGFASVVQGNTTSVDTVSVTPAIGDIIIVEIKYEKLSSADGNCNILVDGKSHAIQRGDIFAAITPDMLDVTKVGLYEHGQTAAGAEVSNVFTTTNGTEWWTDGFDIVIQFEVSVGTGTMNGTWTITHWKTR